MSTAPTSTNPPLVCWNCHERTLGTHFCSSCGKLQQIPQSLDYFSLFEIRKLWIEMDALEISSAELEAHPDNFEFFRKWSASSPSSQLRMNDAYRTCAIPSAVPVSPGIEGERKEGCERKAAGSPELLEVFRLPTIARRASRGKGIGRRPRLARGSAARTISGKLGPKSTRNCNGTRVGRSLPVMPPRAKNHGAPQRIAESPLLHPEFAQRSEGVCGAGFSPLGFHG